MKLEIKNMWTKALRSGEFKQCRGQLEKGSSYCALGVLSALALVEGICTYAEGGKYDGKRLTLSYNVLDWADIKDKRGRFDDTGIAILNDSGASFEEIADTIDKNWENL